MPVTRGKKKSKRERRRFGSGPPEVLENGQSTAREQTAKQAPARRRGWQGPPWLNLTLGIFMIFAGLVFTIVTKGGILILLLYWLVGGFYLFRWYRQYQQKRLL